MNTSEQLKPFQKAATQGQSFFLWSVLSLNLYEIYWGWQMWEVVRTAEGATYKFPSWLRGIFLPISIFWLLPKLQKITGEKFWPLDPPYLATLYFVVGLGLTVAAMAPFGATPWWAVVSSVIGALPLYFVVQAVQQSSHLRTGVVERLPKKTSNVLVAVLSILYFLALLGLLAALLGLE
ncbi:MAG TPA: hypothetical protein VFT87_04485 [Candidatus Saccharimonadales bacterium]|nr:hypothetical protein [Candidatus Saccharimonadales bacterium]